MNSSNLKLPLNFIGKFSLIKSPLKKELAILTIPIFIETLLIMSLGAVDTFMLSRYSDAGVAAVGLVNQVISFCFMLFEVINLGTSVLCAQYLGIRALNRMTTVLGVSLLVNLIVGLIISFSLFFFSHQIVGFLGLKDSLLTMGEGYLRIVGIGAFVQALAMTLSAVLRSNNKAYFPMLVILIVNILNMLGNYALIFGKFGAPALGVNGAAISTVVARVLALIILFVIVFKTTIKYFPTHIFRRFPFDEFRKLMKIGLPSAGESMSYSLSQLVIAYFIATLGVEALAARSYCVNIIMYSYLFCIAISHAGAISIGHLVGAKKWNTAYIMGLYVLRIALIVTLLFSLNLAIFGNMIFYSLTSDPKIIALGTTILWIDVILEIGRPVNILFVNTLQSSGDVNYPFYVGLIFMWSIAVGLAYLFGITWGFGIIGMWWMFTLDENIRGIVFLRRWNSKKWMFKEFTKK